MTKTGAIILACALGLVGIMTACAGYDFGDIVQSQVPREIRQDEGLPSKLSHNEAVRAFEVWQRQAQRELEAEAEELASKAQMWQESLEKSGQAVGFIEGFTTDLVDFAIPAIESVPYGGVLVSALTFAAGWLGVRRPGDEPKDRVVLREEKARAEGEAKAKGVA